MSSTETNNGSRVSYPANKAGYDPANPSKGVLNVNKALGTVVRGALVAGIVMVAASVGWASIGGKVVNDVGTAVPGAQVEVWDVYPTGTILTSGTTDANGEFLLGSVPPTQFDLRVRKATAGGKAEYYPSVIRDLPDPITNVLVILFPVGTLIFTPNVGQYWDTSSTYLGTFLRPGDLLEAYDPEGVLCGLALSVGDGDFLIYVVGDDAASDGVHEGPFVGDDVQLRINGFPATPPAVFNVMGSFQHHLTGATSAHGVTVTGPATANGSPGELTLISYQVLNSGDVADSFALSATLPGWTVNFASSKLGVTLGPGESANVDILVQIPPGTHDTTVTVTLEAVSRTYGFVAAGSITDLSVGTTGVWDEGNGGLLPSQFSLAQNYPNPFNPETEIAFSLGAAGHVRLEVFNLLGQRVAMLVDGERSQGINVVHWDGRDDRGTSVPTGIYFYRLTQQGQSQVRKMVLLK